jgi:ribonuclease D
LRQRKTARRVTAPKEMEARIIGNARHEDYSVKHAWVDTSSGVEAMVQTLEQEDHIGVDMEFMACVPDAEGSVSRRLGPPLLCLIQISKRDGTIFVVDALAESKGINLKPFWQLMGNSRVQKVVHDGREEVSRLVEHTGGAIVPQNLFDTQVACGFLNPGVRNGHPDVMPSLQTLVKKYVGVTLDKELQMSNWMARPLTEGQLQYAANDVRHLLMLRNVFHEMMGRVGYEQLRLCVLEECQGLCELSLEQPAGRRKSKKSLVFECVGRLEWSSKQYAALVALVEWRENESQMKGRKREKVMSSDKLVSLARDASREDELRKKKYNLRKPITPLGGIDAETPDECMHNELCFSLCKTLCLSSGVHVELVPLVKLGYDFINVMRHIRRNGKAPDSHFLFKGWRLKLIGQPLVEFVCNQRGILLSPK